MRSLAVLAVALVGRPRGGADCCASQLGEGRASRRARSRRREGAEPRPSGSRARAPQIVAEPPSGRTGPFGGDARARLLRPRVGRRDGVQRAHSQALHEPRLATWSVGEALLASQGNTAEPDAIVEAWLESPPHRAIILSPTWRDAGIGALYAPDAPREFGGAETIVVTADFGLREGRVTPS